MRMLPFIFSFFFFFYYFFIILFSISLLFYFGIRTHAQVYEGYALRMHPFS